MDTLRALLRLLVGLQLFFIALYLDGHWGLEREAAHVIPAIIYASLFFLYFVYVGMRMYRDAPLPEREEKGVAVLRRAERIVRPILYTAVAVEFIVYWPQNWCKESNALLGGCWPESDFSWWLLAVQVAIPDFLVFLALFPKGMRSLQALLHGEGAGSQSSFADQAQGAAAPLLGKMHYF